MTSSLGDSKSAHTQTGTPRYIMLLDNHLNFISISVVNLMKVGVNKDHIALARCLLSLTKR